MLNFVTLVIVVALVAAVVWYMRRRTASARTAAEAHAAPSGPRRGTVRTLEVGDVLGADGRMWLIEGSLRFDEGGFIWHEHLLVDGADRWWLSVEDDEGALELVRWERLRGSTLQPVEGELEHAGVAYRFSERGAATFTSSGSTGAPPSGRADYVDYEQGSQRLGLERFGGPEASWETSLGTVVSEHEFEVYPGGDTVSQGPVNP